MSSEHHPCPSCGAHVPVESDRCDLCGTPVPASEKTDSSIDEGEEDSDVGGSGSENSDAEEKKNPTVFCNQCGWENPPGAQYCSQCGAELQDLSEAPPAGTRSVTADLPTGSNPEGEEANEAEEQAEMGRQVAWIVGGALILVFALFFVTQWSAQYEWKQASASGPSSAQTTPGRTSPSSQSGSQGNRGQGMESGTQGPGEQGTTDLQTLLERTTTPITGPMARQIDSLRAQVAQASGEEKRQLQEKMVNLLIGAGHPGRAAVVQKKIAEGTGTVDAHRRAADLLYRWMRKVQRQGKRKQVLKIARHAAEAYEAVVKKRPSDLDARTRMAEAYLLTNRPMRGIRAINAVLKDDSTFVPARFQKGLALLQINRVSQAKRQFEKAKQYADKGSPFYRQASRALKVIEKQQAAASSGSSSE